MHAGENYTAATFATSRLLVAANGSDSRCIGVHSLQPALASAAVQFAELSRGLLCMRNTIRHLLVHAQ